MPNITDSRLLQEVIDTEASYNNSLKFLIDTLDGAVVGDNVAELNTFLKRLYRASSDILRNLNDTMAELQKEEPDLMRRMFFAAEREALLNTFFIQATEFLPVFTNIQELLKVATPDRGIGALDQKFKDANRGLGIDSVIIQPVQRAMRYELLLKGLMKDDALDNTQQGIVAALLEKAVALNVKFDAAQESVAETAKAKEKAEKGYEFGDILSGNYTFGSITQRCKYTLWGGSSAAEKDDTISFELVDPSSEEFSGEASTMVDNGEPTPSPLDPSSNM